MDGESNTRLAAETWESLFRAQVTLMRRFEAAGDFSPLPAREYDVLFTLARAPGHRMRLRDLNESMLLSQPSMSRMAERLEQRGLVARCKSDDDARGLVVSLTDKGLALQKQVGRQHVRSISRELGKALSDDEMRTLHELTIKLRRVCQGSVGRSAP